MNFRIEIYAKKLTSASSYKTEFHWIKQKYKLVFQHWKLRIWVSNNIAQLVKIFWYCTIGHSTLEWLSPYEGRLRGVIGRIPPNRRPGFDSGGVGNFNFCPGTGVVSCVVCPVLSTAVTLTLCWLHTQGDPPLCTCLIFWFKFSCSPYRHLVHGYLGCKSRGV